MAPGKNEAKRAAAAALKDLDSEMTEEERERMLRKGMGVDMGTSAIHKGEDKLAEKKLTKEEKKAQTEARRAALAERKAQQKAMEEQIAANRKAAEGGGEDGEGGGEDGEAGSSNAANYAEGGEGGDAVDVSDAAAAAPDAAKPKAGKAKAGSSNSKAKGKAAVPAKKVVVGHKEVQGVLAYQEDMPFFERSGPSASKRKNMSMDIRIGGIRMCAGKQELLDSAVLALNHGVKYGLVGRNGVGKVRARSRGRIATRAGEGHARA